MRYRQEIDLYLEASSPLLWIPDIDKGFIPQGIAFDPGSEVLLLTGYMGGRSSSPIYVIRPTDAKTGGTQPSFNVELSDDISVRRVNMSMPDGTPFRGHAGGVSVRDGFAYVAGSTSGAMYGFSLDSLLETSGDVLAPEHTISLVTPNDRIRASFTGADESLLYAGEFHLDPIFYTHPSHRTETASGIQKAWLFGFAPEADGSSEPVCVYSIPDKIQGVCFDEDYLYLSQTDSLLSARILTYERTSLPQQGTVTALGKDVPLYVLTEQNAAKNTRIPPMSEEILVVEDQMLVLYESASNRYRFGRRMGLDAVLATPVSFFRPE